MRGATSDAWQKMGHDPYRGADEGSNINQFADVGEINQSAKGLFRLAQLTGNSSTLAPGACKRCGNVGHLYFQCRNFLLKDEKKAVVEEDDEDDDPPSDAFPSDTSDEEEEDDDDDSDSDGSSDSSSSDASSSDSSSSSGKKKKKKG